MNYVSKLKDPRWQKVRLDVFTRDDWACRICGTKNKTLHAHHTVYHPYAESPWDYDIETIVTLCCDCHADDHCDLKASQANLLIELAKRGIWSSYHLDLMCSFLLSTDFDLRALEKKLLKRSS